MAFFKTHYQSISYYIAGISGQEWSEKDVKNSYAFLTERHGLDTLKMDDEEIAQWMVDWANEEN